MTLTPEYLAELKRLCEAATEGPYLAIQAVEPIDGFNGFWLKAQPNAAMRGFTKDIAAIFGEQSESAALAAIIAAARTALPALIAEVERLTAENERLWANLMDVKRNSPIGSLTRSIALAALEPKP
jgi:hypothetical protein